MLLGTVSIYRNCDNAEKEKRGEEHGRVKYRYGRIADFYKELGDNANAAKFE